MIGRVHSEMPLYDGSLLFYGSPSCYSDATVRGVAGGYAAFLRSRVLLSARTRQRLQRQPHVAWHRATQGGNDHNATAHTKK